MKSNRFWIITLGIVAAVSLIAALLVGNVQGGALRSSQGGKAHIYSYGNLIETVDLNAVAEPRTIAVSSGGGENIVEVERGRIRVAEANCRDGVCVRQGWTSVGLTPIVCLPNGLVVQIEGGGGEANEVLDGIVG